MFMFIFVLKQGGSRDAFAPPGIVLAVLYCRELVCYSFNVKCCLGYNENCCHAQDFISARKFLLASLEDFLV